MRFLLVCMFFIGLLSCASNQVEKEISVAKQNTDAPTSNSEMIYKKYEILYKSKNLTTKQKDDFIDLQREMIAEIRSKNSEIRRYKVILFKHLADEKYNEKKVSSLKKRIKKIHDGKLELMFSAMDRAKKVLGVEFKNYQNVIVERAARGN